MQTYFRLSLVSETRQATAGNTSVFVAYSWLLVIQFDQKRRIEIVLSLLAFCTDINFAVALLCKLRMFFLPEGMVGKKRENVS